MFYSHNILTKKGGSLGIVWIAANFQPGVHHISLTRREYCSVSIRKACEEVVSPRNPMALRLSASLMVGIARIHCQQTHYIYVESKQVWQRLKHAYERNRLTTDLPTGHSRSEAVTLPDPASQVNLDASFPGQDLSFSLDSLLVADLFSLTAALSAHTPNSRQTKGQGSPFTANPRDISIEEEMEAPLETLQIQVPGEGGDFGDGVLVEGEGAGRVVMMDDVPMPTLNSSASSLSGDGGMADLSSESVCVTGGQEVRKMVERVKEEEEEGGEAATDSVMLFDDKTDSFQLYNESQNAPEVEQGTPILSQAGGSRGARVPPDVAVRLGGAGAGKRVRRKLAFDVQIKARSSTIKDNLNSVHTTLRDKHTLCCPVPIRVKPATLLGQPVCLATRRSPQLLSMWLSHQTPPNVDDGEPEFELESLQPTTGAPLHPTPLVTSLLQEREVQIFNPLCESPSLAVQVARGGGASSSQLSSPGGSAVELVRAGGDDQMLDSHHTTGLTAVFSDVSSFASGRHNSNLGFDTSSAQRQTGPSRVILPTVEGLSPIADVEIEASFSTQHGGLEFPELDVSYGSAGGGPVSDQESLHHSPATEHLADLSHMVSSKMGGRLEVEFRQLLPPGSSRKMASRAFSHMLELVTSQVLVVSQGRPYGAITLTRGPRF